MRTSPLPWPRRRRASNSRWTRYKGLSARSTRTSRRGPIAKTWRASSEPIEPPPPVITTVRSRNSSSTPAARSVTIGRRRRSSTLDLAHSICVDAPIEQVGQRRDRPDVEVQREGGLDDPTHRGTGGTGHRDQQCVSARGLGGLAPGTRGRRTPSGHRRPVRPGRDRRPGNRPDGSRRRGRAAPSGRHRRPLDRLHTAGSRAPLGGKPSEALRVVVRRSDPEPHPADDDHAQERLGDPE